VHDPFAPWRVLSIQCYPDWQSSVDVHEKNRHYVNGPEAFLVTLLEEYRDASKRFLELNERIVKMVTPPNDFLFNKQLRDKLLFENNDYTYSRRYFWAFQALALLNDEIQAMISEYKEIFTADVWSGEHKYIWPGTAETSSRYSNFRKKLSHLQKQFEKEIEQLQHVLELNEREQKDIKSLRDQLFSGTSVLESREAVNQARISVVQGYNIRLLTLVSIFFLPLMFVTSVFGMTNMPPKDSFRPFGIVTATICVPTYFFLVSVNSPETATSALKRVGWVLTLLASGFRRHSDRMKQFEMKYKMGEYKNIGDGEPKRFASRTLSSYGEVAPTLINPRRPSRANVLPEKLPDRPPMVHARTSEMVKFDLPDYDMQQRKAGSRTLEKTLSDPGHEISEKPKVDKGFLRTFSDKFNGSPSPRSSGILV
jgi:Mg2+ and Co2+ transporter CorA